MQLAHRLAWALTQGPTELNVLHHCDNPPCVNPAHLFLGTQRSNMEDAASKGRTAKGLTAARHPRVRQGNFRGVRGSENSGAKLSWAGVAEIRARYLVGDTQIALGRAFGVSNSAIWLVVHNKTWVV